MAQFFLFNFFHFPIKISCCIISNLFHEKILFGYQGILFSFSTNNQVHVHLKTDQVDLKKKPPWNFFILHKLCFETKKTKLGVGHFTSISGHFFANFISFHKTEVLTVILKGPTCQNLNWIKSYDINHNFLFPFSFNLVGKKMEI